MGESYLPHRGPAASENYRTHRCATGVDGGAQLPPVRFRRALTRAPSTFAPEFLDYTSLLYQFPNRAGSLDADLFALGTGFGEYSVGVLGRVGDHGFFVLGQPRPSHLAGGGELVQAGWGAAWNAVRLGLAVRGSYGEAGRY